MSSDPPFRSIAIIGLGLIGGSVALAARQRWPSCRITAIDRPPVIADARRAGAIDAGASELDQLSVSDLVLLAAPVSRNVASLAVVAARASAPVVITDVGGTKRSIVDAAQTLPTHITFIGGHPLAGSEKAGFSSARADLFARRPWILTPATPDSAPAVEQLTTFVKGLGAVPSTLSADVHDRLMALISHLPQLTASALMEVVGRAAGPDGLALAGQGLVDTTRLASSPSSVWKDVCDSNADAIGPALDVLIQRLQDVRAGLDRGAAIEGLFEEAARWRAALMKDRE